MQSLRDLCRQQFPDGLSGKTFALVATATAATATAAVLLVRVRRSKTGQQEAPLPPGPSGWPLLGSIFDMDPARSHESIAHLCAKYGPIISYRLGSQLFIVINDYDLAKEMLEDENFIGRPQTTVFQRQTRGCGLLFSEGPLWRRHRRLALRILRDFGFARDRSVEIVHRQLDDILAELTDAAESGRPQGVLDAFTEATNSVIATLTLGREFKRGDAELEFVRDAARRLFTSRLLQNLPFLFPWTGWLIRLLPAGDELDRVNEEMIDFIHGQIDKRRALMGPDGDAAEPECLCDAYIRERTRAEAAGDFETFKDFQVVALLNGLKSIKCPY